MRVSIVVALSLLVVGVASAQDTTFTGCLTRYGMLIKVAVGDEPARPCRKEHTQVTWNAQGEKGDPGDKGDKGDQGDMGFQGPPGANGQNGLNGENGKDAEGVRFEFVGLSSQTVGGFNGIKSLTNACSSDFPESRMCTSIEVMETSPYPPTTTAGWVRPVIVGVDPDGKLIDASGKRENPSFA